MGSCDGDQLQPFGDSLTPITSISLATLGAPVELNAGLADGPGSDFYVSTNNSALLQGPVIGTGSALNGSLSRSLPFRVDQSPDGLTLLYASVSPRGETASSVTMVIENQSPELRCFVKLDELYFYDSSGQLIEESLDFAFVEGSVATGALTSDTCIESAQKAFLSRLTDGSADNMGGFTASLLEGRLSNFVSEETVLEPLSYDIGDGELEVRIVNRGLVNVNIELSSYILIDENGAALATGFLHGSDTLAPGAEVVFASRSLEFTGSVSSVRVIVDFEPPES